MTDDPWQAYYTSVTPGKFLEYLTALVKGKHGLDGDWHPEDVAVMVAELLDPLAYGLAKGRYCIRLKDAPAVRTTPRVTTMPIPPAYNTTKTRPPVMYPPPKTHPAPPPGKLDPL